MKNLAVLVSGNGSNLQAIIKAVKAGKIKARLAVVVSDRQEAFALERARKVSIPAVFIDPKKFPDRESFDRAVAARLKDFSVDYIILAGFMRILSPYFIQTFRQKILNVHPSLLPAFKGAHAIKDAFDYGVKTTGVTVHFVDEDLDAGAIIAQAPVDVTAKDTLSSLTEKIHKLEHKLYPRAVAALVGGKLRVSGRKVRS